MQAAEQSAADKAGAGGLQGKPLTNHVMGFLLFACASFRPPDCHGGAQGGQEASFNLKGGQSEWSKSSDGAMGFSLHRGNTVSDSLPAST